MVDINLIPKEYRKRGLDIGGVFSRAGMIVLGILILSLLIYGGLFIYCNNVDKKTKDTEQQITNLQSGRDLATENIIDKTGEKLALVEDIFKNHLYWSQFFAEIEKATVNKVYFPESKFSIDNNKINVNLSGKATSYSDIARQMVSFKENPSLEQIEVSGITTAEAGEINFQLALIFSKNILLKTY
jgi:hypothetical protein